MSSNDRIDVQSIYGANGYIGAKDYQTVNFNGIHDILYEISNRLENIEKRLSIIQSVDPDDIKLNTALKDAYDRYEFLSRLIK